MIQDPADELVAAVRRAGEHPSDADRQAVALARRRFGVSLPPPFAPSVAPDEVIPVRVAVPGDGPAIAAVKWRAWRVAYRGILPDPFLDDLDVVPPAAWWTGRIAGPPSHRDGVFVAGRPGTVLGVAAVQSVRDDDLEREVTAELQLIYLDPLVWRRGIGSDLLARAVDHARAHGAQAMSLWVAAGNERARLFYEAAGWELEGATQVFALTDGIAMDELRYRLPLG